MITFIGDCHGKWMRLRKLIRKVEKIHSPELIIQVGDFGIGFNKKRDPKRRFPNNFKFLRGNHDDPAMCREHPSYIGDFGYAHEHSLGFISGADSVDKSRRFEGVDWWKEEQLDYKAMNEAIELMIAWQPKILVTHDCPQMFYDYVTDGKYSRYGQVENCTARAYDVLFENVKPMYWVFGHHHKEKLFTHKGTTFICLPELTVANITTPL